MSKALSTGKKITYITMFGWGPWAWHKHATRFTLRVVGWLKRKRWEVHQYYSDCTIALQEISSHLSWVSCKRVSSHGSNSTILWSALWVWSRLNMHGLLWQYLSWLSFLSMRQLLNRKNAASHRFHALCLIQQTKSQSSFQFVFLMMHVCICNNNNDDKFLKAAVWSVV